MDYFQLLGLPYFLAIDMSQLAAAFHSLSWRFHPDFYQNRSSQEQQISMANAAFLNKAYRTLKDPNQRIAYLIGRVSGAVSIATEPPHDLFEEIFTLQETIESFKAASANEQNDLARSLIEQQACFKKRFDREQEAIQTLAKAWDQLEANREQDFTQDQKTCVQQMRQCLSHQGYLNRVLNDLSLVLGGTLS